MKFMYPAEFCQEEDGQYSVVFVDIPLATCGSTLAEALEMASEALEGRIYNMLEDGDNFPTPSNPATLKPESPNSFFSLVIADTDNFKAIENRAIKKTLTIPAWLNRLAEEQHINFSLTLKEALLGKLAH
jgi:predicted RNase H-like HicB family nuclease